MLRWSRREHSDVGDEAVLGFSGCFLSKEVDSPLPSERHKLSQAGGSNGSCEADLMDSTRAQDKETGARTRDPVTRRLEIGNLAPARMPRGTEGGAE